MRVTRGCFVPPSLVRDGFHPTLPKNREGWDTRQADWDRLSACEDILRATNQQIDAIEMGSKASLTAESQVLAGHHSPS
jgi:hypothetical protein